MSGFLYHVGVQAMCPHAGQVSDISTNSRVLVGGQPVAINADQFVVAGCSFTVSSKPQPCVKVQWLAPATRVRVMGQAVILQTTPSITQSAEQISQGSAIVVSGQVRVKGM